MAPPRQRLSGLTTNSNWNLYGRVATWADCTKFTPPPGTQQLCEATPPAQRAGRSGQFYVYNQQSPAVQLLGPGYQISPDPYAMSRLWEFSLSAIWGQPLNYLNAVWNDAIGLVDPSHVAAGGLDPDRFIAFLLGGPDFHSGRNTFVTSWQVLEYPHDSIHRGPIAPLKSWESSLASTDPGWPCCWSSALPRHGRCKAKRGAARDCWALPTIALLFFPLFTLGYDYRYVIPAFGPLFATASLGGWGIASRISRRVRPSTGSRLAV